MQLKSGMPTIAVRDVEIQRRESDLALATFGRGFYILDDYSPLRENAKEVKSPSCYSIPCAQSVPIRRARSIRTTR